MTGWLLDTNVLSELIRAEPNPAVVVFVERAVPAFVSVVSLHELRFGVERLPEGQRQDDLRGWLLSLEATHRNTIIAVGLREADTAARLRATAARGGKTVHIADGLLAGTAAEHDLVIATRNTADFDGLGVRVANPWRQDPRTQPP